MDGENNGKPYEQMDDLGGFPMIFGNTHIVDTWTNDLLHLETLRIVLVIIWMKVV